MDTDIQTNPQELPRALDPQEPPSKISFPNALNHRQAGPEIRYQIGAQQYGDADVDFWELRASRRALANLKTLLYGAPMLALVRAQCELGDAYFKSLLAASEGRWRECRTDMHVVGMGVRDVIGARKKLLTLSERDRALQTLLPAHPEHYAKPSGGASDDQEGVVEVIGERMVSLRLEVTEDVPDVVWAYADPAYSFKKPTVARLQDGITAYYILHEFRDVEDGCDLRLRVVFPDAAPEVMFSEHAEHMAIEFRFGLKTIHAGQFP
ncbi:hypothetical protein BX600DRAFT_500323 [Xylariales sp. PMI_506]|nr:hypothetical protein BX600DRAFT_500323 [Xylariales sp. PMI_506]